MRHHPRASASKATIFRRFCATLRTRWRDAVHVCAYALRLMQTLKLDLPSPGAAFRDGSLHVVCPGKITVFAKIKDVRE
jgi:hypothetical protein